MGEEEYHVEKILAKRKHRGIPEWKVKWAGWPEGESTWEPREHIERTQVFEQFTQQNLRKKESQTRKEEGDPKRHKHLAETDSNKILN